MHHRYTRVAMPRTATAGASPPWWAVQDLNLRPHACEACALTTELTARRGPIILWTGRWTSRRGRTRSRIRHVPFRSTQNQFDEGSFGICVSSSIITILRGKAPLQIGVLAKRPGVRPQVVAEQQMMAPEGASHLNDMQMMGPGALPGPGISEVSPFGNVHLVLRHVFVSNSL